MSYKRLAVFSHFSNNNSIEEYVFFYLQELKKITSKIIFVSDCETINLNELNKIKDITDIIIIGHHGEYDFGSYKRGYIYALENGYLEDCDELIFANDSCYAPLFSFKDMFKDMEQRNVDFWGNTQNCNPIYLSIEHIQSYFIVFRKNVFNSPVFKNFIENISMKQNKDDIIKDYECGLTKVLTDAGYNYDVYCSLSKKYTDCQFWYFKKLILQDKCPFLKRNIVLLRENFPIFFLGQFIKYNTLYNLKLIQSDIQKNRNKQIRKIIFILIFKTFKYLKIILKNNIRYIKI